MVYASVRGARRWVQNQIQPLYNQLPSSERTDEETKNNVSVETASRTGSFSGSSSNSESSRRDSDGLYTLSTHHHGRNMSSSGSGSAMSYMSHAAVSILTVIPMLIVRSSYLCWLLLTEPLRRRGRTVGGAGSGSGSGSGGRWAEIYEQLEEFKVLVPSFLQPVNKNAPPRPLHPTAWLDGLRGVAAFLVVWHHASLLWFSWQIHYGYGLGGKDDEGTRYFIQWPLVRLLVAGMPHVTVFFVISGYALSYKPLRLSRQGRLAEASEAINSSVFRRHTRLFMMPFFITFICAIMAYLDLFGTNNWKGVAVPSRRPPQPGTLYRQLSHWLGAFMNLVNPLSTNMSRGNRFMYDYNMWTLPVEFDCSMMLFLCQAAFNRLRPRLRIAFLFGIATFAMAYIQWQAFLFICGMLICDIHFELEGTGSPGKAPAAAAASAAEAAILASVAVDAAPSTLLTPSTPSTHTDGNGTIEMTQSNGDHAPSHSAVPAASAYRPIASPWHRRYRTLLGCIVFVGCIYLLSVPESGRGAAKTPGYRTLVRLVPKYHKDHGAIDYWYLPLGAVTMVFTIDRTPALQAVFTHPVAQYLGKISYSMYLVHGTVLWTVGHWLARKCVGLTGSDTALRYGLGIGISAVFVWAIVIFLADLVTRTLDAKSVSFGRVLYERCAQKEEVREPLLPQTR